MKLLFVISVIVALSIAFVLYGAESLNPLHLSNLAVFRVFTFKNKLKIMMGQIDFSNSSTPLSPEYLALNELLRLSKTKKNVSFFEKRKALDDNSVIFPTSSDCYVQESWIQLGISKMYDNGVKVYWIVYRQPKANIDNSTSAPTLLYIHGGGFSSGSILSYRHFACQISKQTNTRLLFVEYRLAPEFTVPFQVEDAMQAYQYLISSMGVPSNKISIIGDSAGGGLTLLLLQSLRDRAPSPSDEMFGFPSSVVVLSPWVDLSMSLDSYKSRVELDALLDMSSIEKTAFVAVGNDTERLKSSCCSALFGSFNNFGLHISNVRKENKKFRIRVYVGTDEVMYDDSLMAVEKIRAGENNEGVEVELIVGNGLGHVYPFFFKITPESKASLDDISMFIVSSLYDSK